MAAAKDLTPMERKVLNKVMKWFEAQRRGERACLEADAVHEACERLHLASRTPVRMTGRGGTREGG